MNFEDLLAADHVWVRHDDLTIEAAGTQQRRVQHIRPVGRSDQNDAFIGLEAIHLDEQLVQRLLTFVVAAAETSTSVAADGVDLVDEDDARCVLLGLLEHVAHAARANADEHLDEVRAGNREERHVRFTRDRACDQRLTGAGRTDQQHTARNAAAQTLEFARVAQEFDDLLQVLLGLVDTGDVLEGDAAVRFSEQFGARLAETQRLAAGTLHLAREENPHPDQRDERQPGDQERNEPGHVLGLRPRRDRDALVVEPLDQRRIAWRIGLERAAVSKGTVDLGTLDQDIAHAALIDLIEQLRERYVLRGRMLARVLEQREERKEQQNDDHPQGEIAQIGVHLRSLNRDRGARRLIELPANRGGFTSQIPLQCRRQLAPCQGNRE